MNRPMPRWHIRPMSDDSPNTVAGTAIRPGAVRWISVIDPDPLSRATLCALLAGMGAEVRAFEAAEPFLAALRSGPPACLISEVRLPAMSGLMLLRHLRSAQMWVPTILVATDPDVPLAVEAIREGALDFLEKPLVASRVTRRIAALLSS